MKVSVFFRRPTLSISGIGPREASLQVRIIYERLFMSDLERAVRFGDAFVSLKPERGVCAALRSSTAASRKWRVLRRRVSDPALAASNKWV